MKVKIDTKPKFHAITILESHLAANMTAELSSCLVPLLQNDVKNAVLILKDIQSVDNAAAQTLIEVQEIYAREQASFVVCDLQPQVVKSLAAASLLEQINYAPTESEASDIVHMEEIERELMN